MKDRFSRHASLYATFRPHYPPALYDFILKHTQGRALAWDCACGNGQVAKDLAPHFTTVIATDISQKQLDNAHHAKNIQYSVMPAEKTSFESHSFDLITVAQAMHWFQIPEFFREAGRVGKSGAVLAYWGYGLFRIDHQIDPIVDDFYVNIIGPYWDPERKLIDQHYRTIDFPFQQIATPQFDFSFDWSIKELEGYISTWSAVQKFITDRKSNPVEILIRGIQPLWNGPKRRVTFPLFLTMGRI